MSYGLNSLKGVTWGITVGEYFRAHHGDTRSFDDSSGEPRALQIQGITLLFTGYLNSVTIILTHFK